MSEIEDIWESSSSYEIIDESSPEVDGKHILARVVGETFFPDTASRNNRFYPALAWVNALQDGELVSKLQDRLVLGTVGHDLPINDKSVRDGLISHIVSKVWIDEDTGVGMAEFLLLDTPPGRVLNTLLRAGVKIKVSTRAGGKFLPKRNEQGQQVVDPQLFKLKTIDFVLDPGYLETNPALVESLLEQGNELMSAELIAHLQEELKVVRAERDDLNSDLNEAKSTIATKEAEATSAKEELALVTESRDNAVASLEEATKTLDEANDSLSKYKELGDVVTIQESLESKDQEMIESLNTYRELGSAEEIKESLDATSKFNEEVGAFDEVEEALVSFRDLITASGTPQEIAESIDTLEAIQEELGSVEEISESLNAFLELIEDLGTPSEIRSVMEEVEEALEKLGSFDEIEEALMLTKAQLDEAKEARQVKELSDLAESLGVDVEKVKKLHSRGLSTEEISETFEGVIVGDTATDLQDDSQTDNVNEDNGKPVVSKREWLMTGNQSDDKLNEDNQSKVADTAPSRLKTLMG